MRALSAAIFAVIFTIVIPSCLFCQEEKAEVKEEATAEKEERSIEQLTKEELTKMIKEILADYDEILGIVPGLNRVEDKDGSVYYTYKLESGTVKKLEELDKDLLIKLYIRIRNEANRLHNERLIMQLEQMRRAQEATRLPPQPPQVPTIPKTPTPPPQPPREPTRR